MKKYIFLVVTLLAFTSFSLAQDSRAGSVLDGMSAKYKALKTFKADFAYTPVNSAGKPGRKRVGDIAVKGVKFKLNMVGQEIYNNGKEIYSFVKETNEVNVTEYDQSADSEFSPANIYSIYKKGYKYSYKGEKVVNGVKCDVVELVPSKSGNVKKVEISVNKANKEIKQWKLWDNSGGYTVFDILQFTPNVALADNFFTFNTAKYPGVEVVDLR